MTGAQPDNLTAQARAGVRRFPWRSLAIGAAGASAVGLLGAAGLAPLLLAVVGKPLAEGTLAAWRGDFGGNALAGWAGDLALWAAGKPLASDDEAAALAAHRELAAKLDALLADDAQAAGGLARLLQAIDAVPQSLAAIQAEVGAQSDLLLEQYALLKQVRADLERLGLGAAALGPSLVIEADRVITALEARADHTDARIAEVLAELRALRDEQRQALINFGQQNQFRDVSIGDVAGRDINKTTIVQQPFTPRPTAATPEELAAANEHLAALPTDAPPEPEDTLPPGSWMARLSRNRQFVGRERDLLALAALLKGGETVAVNQVQSAVASGLGGIGKTQLAIEFAYRYGRYFAGVFWLSFAQADTVATEIARLGGAAHLQLFPESAGLSLDDQVRHVRGRLACGLPYLLIFDNCEDPELVRAHHPGGAARVLITSRNPDWPGDMGVQRHSLGVLGRAESVVLLRQHRPTLSDGEADALAAELGDLPLALHLAGRFLAGPGKNLAVERYLAELRSPRIFERLPLREQDGQLPTGHNRDVARSFALSYERLDPQSTDDVVALRLLARAAHLAPGEVVPAELLAATLEADADDLDAQLAAETALDRLVGLGRIEREGAAGLRMHRLIGVYVRQVSGDEAAQAAVERVVLTVAKQLIDAPTLESSVALLPMLRGVTDAALTREDAEAASLCSWLGRHLDRVGAYALAQPYLDRALALRERGLGPQHPQTAISLNNLAELYRAQGNYAAVRPLYERALAISERGLGPEHPQTAASLNNLALLHKSQGNYAAARPLYDRALALRERGLGPEHPQTAASLNNLAMNCFYQGDLSAAEQLMARALQICIARLGDGHPTTQTIQQSLTVVRQRLAGEVS